MSRNLKLCRFATLLGQFNLQKFISSVKRKELLQEQDSSWWRRIGRHLQDKSLYALNFCSEMMLTPEDTLLVSLEEYGDERMPRRKAVFHHKASLVSDVVIISTFELSIRTLNYELKS